MSIGVLYFVSTTVNPILYNVLSRKYRQAFTMTLCNACMDDVTRQRLQRDGFGAYSVYYSAARASGNLVPTVDTVPTLDTDDAPGSRRRRMWGTATAAAVVGRTHLLSPAESGTASGTTTSSVGSRSPRGSTSAVPGVRYHDGAAADSGRMRFVAYDPAVGDAKARRQVLGDRLVVPGRHSSEARGRADGSSLTEPEESSIGVWPE